MKIKIKIKKIKPSAILPNYAHPGDAGLDLYSLEDYNLQPGERKVFFLGFALEFPSGYVAIVKDKGGLSSQFGLHTLGGVFDAGYRGEYNVNLLNLSQSAYSIKQGDKLAQLIIYPVIQAELAIAENLADSRRGEGRFGSTGRN